MIGGRRTVAPNRLARRMCIADFAEPSSSHLTESRINSQLSASSRGMVPTFSLEDDLSAIVSTVGGTRNLVVLLATSGRAGIAAALLVHALANAVGLPHTLLLSGDAPLCLNSAVRAAGAPCAYSSRTNGRRLQWGRAISNAVGRLFRLRVRAMALLFGAGADVLQVDSDVAWLSNPLALLRASANYSLLAQSDNKLCNAGLVYAQHVGDATADAHTRWFLAEWSNRMHADDTDEQVTLQDVMATMAVGRHRSLGTQAGRGRDERDREFLQVLDGCGRPARRPGRAVELDSRELVQARLHAAGAAVLAAAEGAASSDATAMCRRLGARVGAGANGGKGLDRLRGFELRVPDPHASDPLAATLGGGPPPRDARRAAAAAEAPPLPLPPLPPLGRSGAIFWIAPSWAMPHFVPFLGTERRCASSRARRRRQPLAYRAGVHRQRLLHLSGYPWKRIRPLICGCTCRRAAPRDHLRHAADESREPRPAQLCRGVARRRRKRHGDRRRGGAACAEPRARSLVGLAIGTGASSSSTLPRIAWPDPGADSRWSRLPAARPRAPLGVAAHRARARLLQGGRRRSSSTTAPSSSPSARSPRAIPRSPRQRRRRGGCNPRRAGGARGACASTRSRRRRPKRRRQPPPPPRRRGGFCGAAADRRGGAREEGVRARARAAAAVRVSSKDARLA